MVLGSISIAEFDDGKRSEVSKGIAGSLGLGVTPDQVQILNARAGSVVFDAAVVGLESDEAATGAAKTIKEKAESGTLLDVAKFGPCTVKEV